MRRVSRGPVVILTCDPAQVQDFWLNAYAPGVLAAEARRYPLFADARAALTALLWQKGASGEAESNWAAASGLDPRYRQQEWLRSTRRWPPEPVEALAQFLALAS